MSKSAKRNPIPAPEELLRQYTPLVYHIISPYLSNPEDRKECVNEIFFEFYESLDRFDPEKGSLTTWLAAIARNKAVSFYRKNRRIEEMTASDVEFDAAYAASEAYAASAAGIEDSVVSKADLEAALSKLNPDELELIRKKYYDGMTIKEIAASMNLPYETVKKRHQRSLSKLKLFLLVLALLGILAGCGYLVMRHLGILPGFGVATREDTVFYRMEEPVSLKIPDTAYTAEITSAMYQNGLLSVHFQVWDESGMPLPIDGSVYSDEKRQYSEGNSYRARLMVGSKVIEARSQAFLTVDPGGDYTIKAPYFEDPDIDRLFNGSDTASIELTVDLTRHYQYSSLPDAPYDPDTFEYSDTEETYASFTAVLFLKRTDEEALQQYPHEYTMENGGVAAIPRLEKGELIVELYPLQGDYGYVLPTITEHDFYPGTAEEPDPGLITVTDENGTVLTGKRLKNTESDAMFFSEWNFGPAEPGTYALHIPYLLKFYAGEKQLYIPVDITDCQPTDKTWKFPGGTFKITEITPMTWDDVEAGNYPTKFIPEYYYNEDYQQENFINPYTDADLLWKIDVETSLKAPEEKLVSLSWLAARTKKGGSGDPYTVFPELLDYPENGKMSYLLIWLGGSRYRDMPPYDSMYLTIRGSSYDALQQTGNGHMARLEHEFNLEIKVDK